MFSRKSTKLVHLSMRMTQPLVRGITKSTPKNDIFHVKSADDFDAKVKKSDKPVIVDFCARWCAPCKMLTPRIEKLVGEKDGTVALAKVDIDELTELALNYDVGVVPVLLVIKDGKVVNRMVGLQDTEKIRAWIEESVGKPKRASKT